MRYIDKSKNRSEGLKITSSFLINYCKDEFGRFSDVRYDSRDSGRKQPFCNANRRVYRKEMLRILLENQNDYCCYCLRRLKRLKGDEPDYRRLTLEHIIPRGFTQNDDISYYQEAPGLSSEEVVMRDKYESKDYRQKPNLHPHNVAYNNLVVSCNGTFPDAINERGGRSMICCNEARNEKNAYPIYFHQNVNNLVEYLPDGSIQAVVNSKLQEKVETLIENTNLDCNALRDIRRMWYILRFVSWEELSPCTNDKEHRNSLLSFHLFANPDNIEIAFTLYNKFMLDDYWETLLLYSKFHEIMAEIYPDE